MRNSRQIERWSPWILLVAVLTPSTFVPFLALVGPAALTGWAAALWLWRAGALVALIVTCEALTNFADEATSAGATAWLRHRLLRHVLTLGTAGVRRFPTGDLVSRTVGNTTEAGRVAAAAVWALASEPTPSGRLSQAIFATRLP